MVFTFCRAYLFQPILGYFKFCKWEPGPKATNTSETQFTKLVPCKKPTPVTDRDASITEASP